MGVFWLRPLVALAGWLAGLLQVSSLDGSVCFRVFDKVAVAISVEVGFGHRRSLAMRLVPRDELPPGELM